MGPVVEYLIGLAREHVEEVKLIGAALVFALIVIACNLPKRGIL